jgi:stearoyl-CoA desaturase (delta-9 desaturase)
VSFSTAIRLTETNSQLLTMKRARVGMLHGGMPQGLDEKVIPSGQRLNIARYTELSSPYNSSTAYSDGEGILG